MMFAEITASSLLKIDLDGKKVMYSQSTSTRAAFTIHGAVPAAREDALRVKDYSYRTEQS